MRFHLLHPRDQLVTIMHRIYASGMTTLSGGNLSIREDNTAICGSWRPWVSTRASCRPAISCWFRRMAPPLSGHTGRHRRPPFHQAIYARRPDLRAVVHAHPSALVAFSITHQIPDTSIIPQAQEVCGVVGYAPFAQPGTPQFGRKHRRDLRPGESFRPPGKPWRGRRRT